MKKLLATFFSLGLVLSVNAADYTTTPTTSIFNATQTTTTTTQFPQDISATPADKQLNMKIRDNVSAGYLWNSYETIRLNTTDGNVTIDGTVDSLQDQQKLVDGVRKIDGVKNVTTNLNFTNAK
jgi:osmotically-inducible protein OsmY